MIQYTTPTLHLVVEGIDLTGQHVYVTLTQYSRKLTFDDPTVEFDDKDTHIHVALTQEQTGTLHRGSARVQVNWVDQAGNRDATTIREVSVGENLLAQVVGNG